MALHVPRAPGISQMLKDGSRHFSGLEEAVFRNIAACKEFSQTMKTVYGPQGRSKMIINHLEKVYITKDAATIMRELEIEHPAAKLLVLAAQMQEQEVGDGTNWVVMFAGTLLQEAEDLIRMGLTATDVAAGYKLALAKAIEELPTLTCWNVTDMNDKIQVKKALRTSIMSKHYGQEDFLGGLVADACISILAGGTTFNVDNIRICKILGSGVNASEVIQGMVFKRGAEGNVASVVCGKIAVYSCPFDITTTETKGTVLINSADELAKFSRGEESKMEEQVKALHEAGVTVVAAGGKIGDMALHYLNKYKIMAVRVQSKWDLRRLCKTVCAVILPKMTTPTQEEIGFCDKIYADEIGDTAVTIFKQESKDSRIATIVIRASTENYMNDIETGINDAVNTFKGITRDSSFIAGAGSYEIEISRRIEEYSTQCSGLEQYSIKKFADALKIFPRILADNCGVPAQETVSNLLSAHQSGKTNVGFNCEGEGESTTIDAAETELYDLYLTKFWALKYAVSAACQVLCVDQIIMAKRAGGPASRGPGPQDPDDDE